jgi:hypothetical protein
MACIYPHAPRSKVFCFFSSEKKAFLVLLLEPQEVEATKLPHTRMP